MKQFLQIFIITLLVSSPALATESHKDSKESKGLRLKEKALCERFPGLCDEDGPGCEDDEDYLPEDDQSTTEELKDSPVSPRIQSDTK